MERKLSVDEIEKRFAEIDAGETEEPATEDLAAFAEADEEEPAGTITLEAYNAQRKCLVEPAQSTVQLYHEFGTISTEQIVKDAGQILDEFASDYEKMAKGIETDGIDPFYSENNVRELKRRLDDIEAGTASLEERELIEED